MPSFEIRVRCKNNFIIFTNAPWAKRSQAHGAITNRDRINDNMANLVERIKNKNSVDFQVSYWT